MEDPAVDYSANHGFAVFFTFVAALSQGLGGLIAVLGVGSDSHGTSSAHLMSFSTGVMLYLSLIDIMSDTSKKIGEYHANVGLFLGMLIFLALEFCLPEIEGSDMADLLGLSWKKLGTPDMRQQPEEVDMEPMQALPPAVMSDEGQPQSLRRRDRSAAAPVPAEAQPAKLSKKKAAEEAKEGGGKARSRSPARSAHPAQPSAPSAEQPLAACADEARGRQKEKSVAFTGMMAMVSISLHNIPEGIAVYLTCLKGVESGLPLALAMAFHNIPEGMAVAGPLYAATNSKRKAVFAATASGAFEIVGAVLVIICYHAITSFLMEFMLSVVAGIMVTLALIELLPSTLEALTPRQMACSCIGGMMFMFFSKTMSQELIAHFA